MKQKNQPTPSLKRSLKSRYDVLNLNGNMKYLPETSQSNTVINYCHGLKAKTKITIAIPDKKLETQRL